MENLSIQSISINFTILIYQTFPSHIARTWAMGQTWVIRGIMGYHGSYGISWVMYMGYHVSYGISCVIWDIMSHMGYHGSYGMSYGVSWVMWGIMGHMGIIVIQNSYAATWAIGQIMHVINRVTDRVILDSVNNFDIVHLL